MFYFIYKCNFNRLVRKNQYMFKITLLPLFHKNNQVIAIHFEYDTLVKNHIKSIEGVKWSATHKTFYIENSAPNKRRIYQAFRNKNWFVDYSALIPVKTETIKAKIDAIKLPTLQDSQRNSLERFKKWMQQKRLSDNTIDTYVDVTYQFLRYLQLK